MTAVDADREVTNRLLKALPPETLRRLAPCFDAVTLKRSQVIDHVDDRVEYSYFINRGLVSVVKTMRDGRVVEIGAVGVEGITDSNALFILDNAVLETIVQIPGAAYRIRRQQLIEEMARDEALQGLMQRYARFAYGQLAQTAACNRLHSLEERCCRWLLTSHDSALADSFPLTHEFLAMMLGVQRAGVSIVASFLKKAGLIDYSRGRVTITDRAGLEEASCECYDTVRAEMNKLFPA